MYIFDSNKPIAIGCDHAGFDVKEDLLSFLDGKEMKYKDFGTFSTESVDYPDFAHPVAYSVENGESSFGILLLAAQTELPLPLINTRASGQLFAGAKNLPNWNVNTIMQILFVFLHVLLPMGWPKKCWIFL